MIFGETDFQKKARDSPLQGSFANKIEHPSVSISSSINWVKWVKPYVDTGSIIDEMLCQNFTDQFTCCFM